jgi:hypothetical protein
MYNHLYIFEPKREENLKGRDHSEDVGVDGRILRMNLKKIFWEDVDWKHVAQERDQWRGLVNTLMNFRVTLKAGNFLTSLATISF